MTRALLIACAACAVLGSAAQAQTARPHIGLGLGYLMDNDADVEIPAIAVRGGVDIGDHWGVEFEAGTGLDSDANGPVEAELDHLFTGFVRARAPLSPRLEGFVRGGYYFARTTATVGATEITSDVDDFAAGLGLEFSLAGPHRLRAEYTNYGLDDGGHAIGATYVFGF